MVAAAAAQALPGRQQGYLLPLPTRVDKRAAYMPDRLVLCYAVLWCVGCSRVSPEDISGCEDRFNKSKMVHSIMRHVAETTGENLDVRQNLS
jgi:hypothetical protein